MPDSEKDKTEIQKGIDDHPQHGYSIYIIHVHYIIIIFGKRLQKAMEAMALEIVDLPLKTDGFSIVM